jgi:small subunit ribosomal protein S1
MSQPPEPRHTEDPPQGEDAPSDGATPLPASEGSAVPVQALESAEDAVQGGEAGEVQAGEVQSGPQPPAEPVTEEAGAVQAGEEPPAEPATEDAAAAGDGPKKRKRRKRKKKPAAEAQGDDAHASAHVPFLRFLDSGEGRRHAFAVGEIVAGRVERVEHGVTLVNLFGKALAIVDEHEPHEVQPLPEPAPEPEAAEKPEAAAEPDAAAEADAAAEPDATAEPELTEAGVESPEAPAEPHAPASATAVAEAPAGEGEDDEADAPAEPQPAPPEPPPLGAIFRGRIGAIAESGHVAIVNRAVDRDRVKAALAQAREERRRVYGVVYGFNRGGFDVLVDGVRAFCPASAMALEHVDDPRPYVGKKLEFSLPPNKSGGGIIVSRRSILEREGRKRARQRLKSIRPGHRMVGIVTDVREFGAFVDLGEGLEGMVHVSELSWQREARPSDVVKTGDEVVVRVLEVKPASRKERHGRVSLSMRAVEPDPWDQHAELLTPGAPRKGRVVRTTDFGAFIELAPGIDGLLHISELGRELNHASQALSRDEELDVVIDRVDLKQRRISLSRLSPMEAQLLQSGEVDPSQRPRSLKPGSSITVLVERVDHGGVQVKVQGVLGRRGRGFIPNRELVGPEGSVDRRQLVAGSPLEVKIIGVERDGGLKCSLRARQLDEERKAVQSYRREASKQGLGTFGDLLRAKLGGGGSEGPS